MSDKRHGVYQYNLAQNKINFSSSRGSGRFSFATKNYFYVPQVNNERKISVEKWLSKMEAVLCNAVKKLNDGTEQALVGSRDEADILLKGFFSLRYRTEVAINASRTFLESHPEIRKQMNVSDDRDINLVVLENMINGTAENAIHYRNCKVLVFKNDSGEFIMGDQPFLGDILNNGIQFVALSPNFIISIQRADLYPHFSYTDVHLKFLDMVNQFIARQARKWIIAKDKRTLEKYISFAHEPKQDDTPSLEVPRYLINGSRIV